MSWGVPEGPRGVPENPRAPPVPHYDPTWRRFPLTTALSHTSRVADWTPGSHVTQEAGNFPAATTPAGGTTTATPPRADWLPEAT